MVVFVTFSEGFYWVWLRMSTLFDTKGFDGDAVVLWVSGLQVGVSYVRYRYYLSVA